MKKYVFYIGLIIIILANHGLSQQSSENDDLSMGIVLFTLFDTELVQNRFW